MPPPIPGYRESLPAELQAHLARTLSCSAVGSVETVTRQMQAFVSETGADELMVTGMIFDHTARLRSYGIAAQAAGL